jgi:hypothetical protein
VPVAGIGLEAAGAVERVLGEGGGGGIALVENVVDPGKGLPAGAQFGLAIEVQDGVAGGLAGPSKVRVVPRASV